MESGARQESSYRFVDDAERRAAGRSMPRLIRFSRRRRTWGPQPERKVEPGSFVVLVLERERASLRRGDWSRRERASQALELPGTRPMEHPFSNLLVHDRLTVLRLQ